MIYEFISEPSISDKQKASICQLLVKAYPSDAQFFAANSYWGSLPEWRLIARQNEQQVGHLALGQRQIIVAGQEISIVGIGAVATDPSLQGQGLGKQMFARLFDWLGQNNLADFAFLECRAEVVPFYQKAGFLHSYQQCRRLDPDDKKWTQQLTNVLTRKLRPHVPDWNSKDLVDLCGLPW